MKPSQTFIQAAVLATFAFATATSVFAMEAGTSLTSAPSNRSAKKLGVYLGYGEPAPTVLGINVAYNLADFVRLRAGYGKLSSGTSVSVGGQTFDLGEASTTTLGAGARFSVPGWNLTPTAGIHFANVSYTGNGLTTVGGFNESGSHVYSTLGVDWQAQSGFNAGLGYQFSFKSGADNGLYLNAGWFFDLS